MQGWFLLFALLFGSMGAGADGGSLQDQVRTAYRGKVLTLRQFYDAEKLHFGANGHLVGEATTGAWTVDGQLQVTDIHLQSGMLQIKGKRLTLVFDPTTKKLRDLMEISPKQSIMEGHIFRGRKRRERAREARVLEVDLELPAAAKLMTDVESAMSVAFLSPNDDLVDFVPEFWRDFVLQQEGKPPHVAPPGSKPVYKYGETVSKPRVLYQPDPEYSEAARQAGYFGDAVFSLVAIPQGNVRDVKIVTPAGLGLDEEGIKVVNQWRLEPGRKDGVPVAVRLDVSMSWRMY